MYFEGVTKLNKLDPKTRELIAVSASIAANCQP
ncbi:MAG: carboxymuconolactone decarboxylase family protein [Desulfocucumaceae bacterium]